jgi:hypothetical protein
MKQKNRLKMGTPTEKEERKSLIVRIFLLVQRKLLILLCNLMSKLINKLKPTLVQSDLSESSSS